MSFMDKLQNMFKPKTFYAICHKDGHGTIEAAYIVHAFKDERLRDIWIENTNSLNRSRTGSLLDVAFAVPGSDVNVRKAINDVKANPDIYSSNEYINNRIYIEHL